MNPHRPSASMRADIAGGMIARWKMGWRVQTTLCSTSGGTVWGKSVGVLRAKQTTRACVWPVVHDDADEMGRGISSEVVDSGNRQ